MSYIKIWIYTLCGQPKKREPALQSEILKQVCAHILNNAKDKGIYIDRINGSDEYIHVLMLLKYDNSISK
ncbi:MAG TPA: transposase [Parafilimonas sp.]|jgi:REP element-mobilizing transposase RayT